MTVTQTAATGTSSGGDAQPAERVGRGGLQGGQAPAPEQQAEAGAERGEHQRLDDVLAHQASGAGAERRLHRGLAGPRRGAGDEQAADVHAGDEQQDGDADRERQQRPPHVAGGVEVQRHRLELPARGAVEGVRRRDLAADPGDVGLGIGDGDARPHPADHPQVALAARSFGEAAVERLPRLEVVGDGGIGRHHQPEGRPASRRRRSWAGR